MAADNALVSNSQISNNPDLPVRSTATAAGKLIQHVRLDLGSGTSEAVASGAIKIKGEIPDGGAISGTNPMPIAFRDLFGNSVVPTGLNASGVIVMGVLPLDPGLNIQEFSPAGEVYVQSLVANDDVDSGGPIKIGGKAATNNDTLTAVADGDRANLSTDRRNRLIIDSDRLLVASVSVTTTTETTIIAAPGAGIKIQVYKVLISSILTSNNSLGASDFDGVEFRFGGAGSYYMQTTCCGQSWSGPAKEVSGIDGGRTLIDLAQGHWDGAANEKFAARRMAITLGNTYTHYITAWYRLMPT